MIKRVGKRGDTLIEVMLAVGIFSMVAVSVVAVMSGGTSSAQTALETTLAREEIDAQAEALRFIHSAYIADKNASTTNEDASKNSKYGELWKKITTDITKNGHAISIQDKSEAEQEAITKFTPSRCQDLYEDSSNSSIVNTQKAFVLNTQALRSFKNFGDIIKSGNNLQPASTYPHLVFESGNITNDKGALAGTYTEFSRAEGIYIVAVRDPNSTLIVNSGKNEDKEAAYFDFYIRTCWYGTGDQTPSTISTVMRLYDPDAVKEVDQAGYLIQFHMPGGAIKKAFVPNKDRDKIAGTEASDLLDNNDYCWYQMKLNYSLIGSNTNCERLESVKEWPEVNSRKTVHLYPGFVWVDVNDHDRINSASSSGGLSGVDVKTRINGKLADKTDNLQCAKFNNEKTGAIGTEDSSSQPESERRDYCRNNGFSYMKVDDIDFSKPVLEGSKVVIIIESSTFNLVGCEFCKKHEEEVTFENVTINGKTMVTIEFTAKKSLADGSGRFINVNPFWKSKE